MSFISFTCLFTIIFFAERDVSLKRDVVVVKEQRYSCCRPKFSHTFKDVGKGIYIIQIRLRLTGEAINENNFLYRNPNFHPHLVHHNQPINNGVQPNVLNVQDNNRR